MKQAAAGVVLLLAVAVLAGLSYWTGRVALRAIRRWKAGLDQPLIPPDPIVVDRLAPHWPVSKVRWPQPFVDGERRLRRELFAVYAYEAWRKAGRIRAASELALVVGGAWLGTSLSTIFAALFGNTGTFVLGFVPAVYADRQL